MHTRETVSAQGTNVGVEHSIGTTVVEVVPASNTVSVSTIINLGDSIHVGHKSQGLDLGRLARQPVDPVESPLGYCDGQSDTEFGI